MDQLAANKALVSQFWQEVYEGRNYARIGDFFAADGEYVDVAMPDSVARVEMAFVDATPSHGRRREDVASPMPPQLFEPLRALIA